MQWEQLFEIADRWWSKRAWLRAKLVDCLQECRQSVEQPSSKQFEAYGRYFHALSVAAIVGAATIWSSTDSLRFGQGFKIISLLIFALWAFFNGSRMSRKGEV